MNNSPKNLVGFETDNECIFEHTNIIMGQVNLLPLFSQYSL